MCLQVDDYLGALLPAEQLNSQPLKGKTLGVVKQTMGDGVDPSVKAAVTAACAHMESLGAKVRMLASPLTSCCRVLRAEYAASRVGGKREQTPVVK